MKTSLFLGAFFLVSLVHILAELFGWPSVIFYTKIFLMPLLFLALWRSIHPPQFRGPIRWAGLALFFSTCGDLFLLVEKSNHLVLGFYLGLGSFLIAQLCYNFSFMRLGALKMRKVWMAIYSIYFVGFVYLLIPSLPAPILVAVVVYGLALTAMSLNSWRTLAGQGWIRYQGVAGALLFLISDSLLAINRFKSAIPGAGFWIMLTYITAQYLIISSIVTKFKSDQLVIESTD